MRLVQVGLKLWKELRLQVLSDPLLQLRTSSIDEENIPLGTPSDDAQCIFCDGKFFNEQRGAIWVRCVMFQYCAQDEREGTETEVDVCESCKGKISLV